MVNRVYHISEQQEDLGSMSISEQMCTYPSPSPTLPLPCSQLTLVGLGEG